MATGDGPHDADGAGHSGVAQNPDGRAADEAARTVPGRRRKRRRRRGKGGKPRQIGNNGQGGNAGQTGHASQIAGARQTGNEGQANGGQASTGHAGRNGGASAPRAEGAPRPRRDGADAVPVSGPFYAALDLGTNNCRLLIAAPRDRGFRVVDAFSRIVRLGEGIGVNGRLGEMAMGRAIDALRICAQKLKERNVERVRMIATEACRAAANGAEFIVRVREETGLALEIVSQEAEARLAVTGCASLVDSTSSGVILFDIGGGSSELVWIDLAPNGRRRMADRVRSWMSLPVGVVNISERHGGRQITPATFATMVDEVATLLAAFPEGEMLDRAVAEGRVHMLGTSGTVTTLAGIHLELPRYDRRRVDGTWLSGQRVDELIDQLVGMDYAARVANPCIGEDRAELVLAGCAILAAFRRRWRCERMRVADRGLREGMLVELMAEDGVWRKRGPSRKTDARHG